MRTKYYLDFKVKGQSHSATSPTTFQTVGHIVLILRCTPT